MNQLDIKQIVQDCFLQFYNSHYESLAGADHTVAEVRRYAVNLWDNRNADEIQRDETHGVACMMYIQWCGQKWREITQSPNYHNDVIAREIAHVKTTVCIWAAIDFKEHPEVYSGPDSGFRIEEFARHQWLRRSDKQVQRDKRLGIIQDDYYTWCAGEFSKLSVRVC
jgi:hypothetical protein